MSYVALYRKYRSQSFGEVIGQNHVTTVLQNAIRHQRIAHAYLFCGPRGCGKTSTARLLARALNCISTPGPTAEPCGVCALCVGIKNGSCMDVIEMDAASETGIDDVREKIIENAKFAPGEARFKVYIIDEVHDLSLKAFDSLLKTIEEPPAHVIFILATTEAHKVPITVRSRCQRLDFKRGNMEDLVANLTRVLEAEQIQSTPEAVSALARAAEGSFRDSLSLLEQVLAYAEDGKLTAEAVYEAVGSVGPEMLDEITRVIASDDMAAACAKATELVDSGKDIKQLLVALQGHFADLIKASVAQNPAAVADVSPERFAHLKDLAKPFTSAQMLKMIDVMAEAERDIRFTNQHGVLLMRTFWTILPSSLAAMATAPVTEAMPQPRPAPPAARPTPGPTTQPAPPKAARSAAPQASQEPKPQPEMVAEPPDMSYSVPAGLPAIDLDGMRRMWPKIVRKLVETSPRAEAFMNGAEVKDLRGTMVVVGFANEFALERVDKPKARAAIEEAIALVLSGAGLKVKCELNVPVASAASAGDTAPSSLDFAAVPDTTVTKPTNGDGVANEKSPEPVEDDVLQAVLREFNGTLVE